MKTKFKILIVSVVLIFLTSFTMAENVNKNSKTNNIEFIINEIETEEILQIENWMISDTIWVCSNEQVNHKGKRGHRNPEMLHKGKRDHKKPEMKHERKKEHEKPKMERRGKRSHEKRGN